MKRKGKKESSSKPNKKSKTQQYPYRNIQNLFTPLTTLTCAKSGCIPCAYKIAAFDIALDTSFTQCVPNLRPESCPRHNTCTSQETTALTSTHYFYGYASSDGNAKILTVGDGDFSFSLALARILGNENSSQLVATSYESLETLQKVYPQIQNTIEELHKRNVEVYYNVDATDLQNTLPSMKQQKFHRICWNFPCTAIANGQDGQNQEMQANQGLVQRFVKQCVDLLHPTMGEIHCLHKTKPPYDQWRLEKIAFENPASEQLQPQQALWSQDKPCPFEYKGRIVFDKCLVPPYTPRKALDKKSFPCHDACLYVFGWKKNQKRNNSDMVTIPPSLHMIEEKFQIAPVTKKLIDNIRSQHLRLGSYKDRKKK